MEDFVTFEIAKKLKDKGFREECLCHYVGEDLYYNIESPIANNQLWFSHNKFDNIWHRDNVDAPTIPQVLKWLREKGVDIYCTPNWHNKTDKYYVVCIVRDRIYNHGAYIDDNDFSTYEKAALAGVNYCLENLI